MLTSVLGFLFLMAVWFAVQDFLRRRLRAGEDNDVLQDMVHGCGNCEDIGSCARSTKPPQLISIEFSTTKSVSTNRRQPV